MSEAIYKVQAGDNLSKIIKKEYGFKSQTDIMNMANKIKSLNNLKNINLIKTNQEL